MNRKNHCDKNLAQKILEEASENPKDKSFLIKSFGIAMVVFASAFAALCLYYTIKQF